MFNTEQTRQEVVKNPDKTYSFTVIRPGGNDTALVMGVVDNKNIRKGVNDIILATLKNVEQVGFVNLDPAEPELMMAGGEFCGNATRSTAWLSLDGKQGEVSIQVSGVEGRLKAGVTGAGEAYAQMPIYKDLSKIRKDGKNRIVEMEGITQYINYDVEEIVGLSEDELKQKAMTIIKEKNLDGYPAAGVIWSKREKYGWRIIPVVYVKNADTLYAETACGSGTAALGLVLALENGRSIKDIPIVQPTNMPIKVSVDFDGKSFGYTQISGPIEKLTEATLVDEENASYVIDRITDPKVLESALRDGGLTDLYKDVFFEAPYFESFTDEMVKGFFEDYRSKGILLLAKNQEKVIGFGAAVPLATVPDIAQIIGVPEDGCNGRWYIADLGVKKEFRRKDIGRKLTTETMNKIQVSGGTVVDLRTSVNNLIALSLYRQLGFLSIPEATQQVTEFGATITDRTLFLTKKL